MEFMKIASAIIIGGFLVVDWLSTLTKDWESLSLKDWIRCFIEPFCLIGGVMICMEIWG